MRKLIQFSAVLCVGSALAGCATWASSSAPAAPGYVYVTGHKNNMPAIWMCPDQPGKAECTQVDVTEVSE
ncbi:uncharacterized protein SOCE26_000520 [Sorangium cellulosum]|uniref:Secreted protein n=1 Tax=Sorangium cellulosum TaxID=56 RepID=A0A2L0EH99_SORCE|nr:hypothetical protein [Sorangium cellulosum]AUX38674.1 uncharacterized protein SOCE26_000520 [Sorangium cellulosum]